jgi:hypothetical protein
MKHVHRAGVGARPLCGAPDGFLSFSGNAHFITCPKCKEASLPDRAAQLASLREAAERFRTSQAKREAHG